MASRYVAESISTDAGCFGHVGLCQLRVCMQLTKAYVAKTYLLTIISPDIFSVCWYYEFILVMCVEERARWKTSDHYRRLHSQVFSCSFIIAHMWQCEGVGCCSSQETERSESTTGWVSSKALHRGGPVCFPLTRIPDTPHKQWQHSARVAGQRRRK